MTLDLHIHTCQSDGTDTPEQVIEKAAQKRLGAVAITDHDSVGGVAAGAVAARKAGIAFVAGLELSTYSTTEIHILGYGIDVDNGVLLEKLDDFAQRRKERAKAIVERLAQFGIELDYDALSRAERVGRLHIAAQMVERGYCASVQEAFERYLGARGVAYFPSKRIIPADGVKLIKAAGGLPVIAHPMRFLQQNKLNDLVLGLKPLGLAGIETYYPAHDATTTARFLKIARENGLIATGGTDYHGANRSVELGSVDWRPDALTARKLRLTCWKN